VLNAIFWVVKSNANIL